MYLRELENIEIVVIMQKRSDLYDVKKGIIIGFWSKGGCLSEKTNFVNCSDAILLKVHRA